MYDKYYFVAQFSLKESTDRQAADPYSNYPLFAGVKNRSKERHWQKLAG